MTPHDAPGPLPTRGSRLFRLGAIVVAIAATAGFAYNLSAEPSFVDEWAYLSQTYYADYWLDGRNDRAEWLDYPAYDLPPLPKYLFGTSLRLAGYPRPRPADAYQWYRDTHSRCGTPAMLTAARWPAVGCGVLGCLAVYALGTMAYDRWVGLLATLLLAFNPLYRLHARRAMSDVVSECLILLTAAAFLWAWRRLLAGRLGPTAWLAAATAGVAGGLAPLAKLNGALGMIIVVAWAGLAIVLPRVPFRRKLAVGVAATGAGLVALTTFVVLNPFLTAHPDAALNPDAQAIAKMSLLQRLGRLVDHRLSVSRGQMELFPHNALPGSLDKLGTVAIQGFGRFGPFGPHASNSVKRYDWSQDWGAAVWLPIVALGVIPFYLRGRAQREAGEAPAGWAILVQAGVAAIVVTAYLPLAWDRYYLSLQPGAALLGAGTVVAVAGRVCTRRRRTEGS